MTTSGVTRGVTGGSASAVTSDGATTDAVASSRVPGSGSWSGMRPLLRLALRRERVRLAVWLAAILAFQYVMVAGLLVGYPDAASRAGGAVVIDNPGSTYLIGRIYRAEDYSWGVMTGHQSMVLMCVAAALLGMTTLVRHTRAEEESGRAELVRTASVARRTPLSVALLVATGAVGALGIALAILLIALGEDSIDPRGATTFAAAVTMSGLVFTGVAAVCAQLAQTARAATGLASVALGAAFLIRGAGDVFDNGLRWVTPISWSQQTHPWDANRWWSLTIGLAATTLLVGAAYVLQSRRDLGAGYLTSGQGRSRATDRLATEFGLAARLNRTTALGWAIGLGIFGLVYGPVLSEAQSFITDMPVLDELLPAASGADGTDVFASIILALAAILASIPAVQVLTRLCSDEAAGRTGPLLATSTSRAAWYAATVAVAGLVALGVAVCFGAGFGASAALSTGRSDLFGDILIGSLGYLPAAAVVIGVAAALAGWLPRAIPLAWVLVSFAVAVLYVGGILDWPAWVRSLSPYHHVAARPAAYGDAAALVVLLGLATGLTLLGLIGYRRRAIT